MQGEAIISGGLEGPFEFGVLLTRWVVDFRRLLYPCVFFWSEDWEITCLCILFLQETLERVHAWIFEVVAEPFAL